MLALRRRDVEELRRYSQVAGLGFRASRTSGRYVRMRDPA